MSTMRAAVLALALVTACAVDSTGDTPHPVTGVSCDVDGDGHDSLECGGDDCCDTDEAVPSSDFHWQPTECGGYDYDCDGSAELGLPYAVAGECRPNGCGSTHLAPGWQTVPACGQLGRWGGHCHYADEYVCEVFFTDATQRCR